MVNNKIFIFYPYQIGITLGGPAGFIAHNLWDKPRDIFLLAQDFKDKKLNFFDKVYFKIKKNLLVSKGKREIFVQEHEIHRKYKTLQLYNYKYLYFHDCETLYACRNLINEEQFIILQSHSPELPSVEYRSTNSNNEYRAKYIENSEQFAFQRADIAIFPSEGCAELYSDVLPVNSKKYFILSGGKSNYNISQIDTSYIQEDKINLLYIGRRNSVKGFDIVLSAFRKSYKKNRNINLIIIGGNKNIEEEGIIDIGFSNSPINWYQSVDYVINANRQSYFDLSVIEALSTGVPMIMANNYGHRWFNGKSELITMFDGSVEGLSKILESDILTKRDLNNRSNIELYENFLTDKLYYKRFKKFFEQLKMNEV